MALDFDQIEATTLAYLAGIIDGEGSIMFRRQGRGIQVCLSVALTDPEPLHLLRVIFGGSTVRSSRLTVTGKSVYRWYLGSVHAEVALRAMLPYFLVKRAKADVALKIREMGKLNRWSAQSKFDERENLLRGWSASP